MANPLYPVCNFNLYLPIDLAGRVRASDPPMNLSRMLRAAVIAEFESREVPAAHATVNAQCAAALDAGLPASALAALDAALNADRAILCSRHGAICHPRAPIADMCDACAADAVRVALNAHYGHVLSPFDPDSDTSECDGCGALLVGSNAVENARTREVHYLGSLLAMPCKGRGPHV